VAESYWNENDKNDDGNVYDDDNTNNFKAWAKFKGQWVQTIVVIQSSRFINQNHNDKFYYNKIAFQLKAGHLQTGYTDKVFCSCDLNLNQGRVELHRF